MSAATRKMESLFLKFLIAAPTYGVVRKIPMLWNTTITELDNNFNYVTRPMLTTEKAAVMGMSAFFSLGIFPIWVMSDLMYLEVKLRGLDPKKYGYDHSKSSFSSKVVM